MESQTTENVELPNQCLGITVFGEKCTKMLPKGKHVCFRCQNRINSGGKLAAKISSGNGQKKGHPPLGI